jgi:hypothetical protein
MNSMNIFSKFLNKSPSIPKTIRIDIQSREYMETLPQQVLKNWHGMVVEHACQTAEKFNNATSSSKLQSVVNGIRLYIQGQIKREQLDSIYDSAYHDVYDPAIASTSAAYNTARGAYHEVANSAAKNSANYAANHASYYAENYADRATARTAASDAAYNQSMRLYKEWLMDEVAKYKKEHKIP